VSDTWSLAKIVRKVEFKLLQVIYPKSVPAQHSTPSLVFDEVSAVSQCIVYLWQTRRVGTKREERERSYPKPSLSIAIPV
jgi:hypothetical protein